MGLDRVREKERIVPSNGGMLQSTLETYGSSVESRLEVRETRGKGIHCWGLNGASGTRDGLERLWNTEPGRSGNSV